MFPGSRNVLLLAASQALMLSSIVIAMTLAAVLGSALAADKELATLPVAVMVIGTALASLPAALLMRRYGRRAGFLLGAILGGLGSVIAAYGLHSQSLWLFAFGHLFIGSYQGFANYYRFAAAEAVAANNVSKAISLVVAGGVVAAFVGPLIAHSGRDWLPASGPFVGSYLAQGALSLLALLLLARVRIAPAPPAADAAPARPWRQIVAQPPFLAAVFGAAVGYAVMIMVMTATPLAMLGCGLAAAEVTPVIQWHVVGMFAPSFFTGGLIKRYGAPRIMQSGFVLLLLHVAVALSGIEFLHFFSALLLLGVGWNFAFIGGTALLTATYHPSEQMKVQATNELAIFGLVALTTLSAGWLYESFGWATLNLAVLPLLILALVAVLAMPRRAAPE